MQNKLTNYLTKSSIIKKLLKDPILLHINKEITREDFKDFQYLDFETKTQLLRMLLNSGEDFLRLTDKGKLLGLLAKYEKDLKELYNNALKQNVINKVNFLVKESALIDTILNDEEKIAFRKKREENKE